MEEKEYYGLDEIFSKNVAFVLDTSLFHSVRTDPQPIAKLESLVEWRLNPSLKAPNIDGLPEELELEIKHLADLSKRLRSSNNYFLTKEVVAELRAYFLKADKSAGDLAVLGVEAPLVESFLSSLANATCTAYSHCVQKSEGVIRESKELFKEYYNWVDNFSSMREANIYQKELSVKSKRMSVADKRILSLAMCIAWTRPTVLLTGDVKHIGISTQAILDSYKSRPESPLYSLEVYAGFERGWKLWADSDSWKKQVQNKEPPVQEIKL